MCELSLETCREYVILTPALYAKGSFNPANITTLYRRFATRGMLSPACHTMTQCNTCVFEFMSYPNLITPGNFWTVDCEYVNKLTPPMKYEQERRNLCKLVAQVYGSGQSYCPRFENETTTVADQVSYGFGRYAMERWILSHPDVRPCVVFPVNLTLEMFGTGFEAFTPQLTPVNFEKYENLKRNVRRKIEARMMQSFSLLVHEHAFLHQPPNPKSGFCDQFFPKWNRCAAVNLSPDFLRLVGEQNSGSVETKKI